MSRHQLNEEAGVLMGGPGVMILHPGAVVSRLKRRPWQQAQRFIGNRSVADAFDRHVPNGDGLDSLEEVCRESGRHHRQVN